MLPQTYFLWDERRTAAYKREEERPPAVTHLLRLEQFRDDFERFCLARGAMDWCRARLDRHKGTLPQRNKARPSALLRGEATTPGPSLRQRFSEATLERINEYYAADFRCLRGLYPDGEAVCSASGDG